MNKTFKDYLVIILGNALLLLCAILFAFVCWGIVVLVFSIGGYYE